MHHQQSVSIMICFVPFFATEEGPFGAETFCQVKLSTTCLTLKNQQIPIHRPGNASLLYTTELLFPTTLTVESCCHIVTYVLSQCHRVMLFPTTLTVETCCHIVTYCHSVSVDTVSQSDAIPNNTHCRVMLSHCHILSQCLS